MKRKDRLTEAQKNTKGKQWYKDKADELVGKYNEIYLHDSTGISRKKRLKVNYDIYNNKLNLEDFDFITKPYGDDVGELPQDLSNRDIISPKIKKVIGMETKRPFSWKVFAVNPEATTRKEQAYAKMVREWVVQQIMDNINQEVSNKYKEQLNNAETPEQQQQIQEQIQEEVKTMTPIEAKKYMEREHQDPAEVLNHQLLEYAFSRLNLKDIFEENLKNLVIGGEEVSYIGVLNGKPEIWTVSPKRFRGDLSAKSWEDGEFAVATYYMGAGEVVKYFGDELTEKEIDKIYENAGDPYVQLFGEGIDTFETDDEDVETNNVKVYHTVWKSLKLVKILTYKDEETGEILKELVNENYRLNLEAGDLDLKSYWIPEVYETWIIDGDIYVNMQPVQSQLRSLDDLYDVKLPYFGVRIDDGTSIVDRLINYQYFYNIVMYKIEQLIASDKGKKLFMNIGAIPNSKGIDLNSWKYLFESTPFAWYNPQEEGNTYQDVSSIAKVVDLSLASDINSYMNMAIQLKRLAGQSVGIPEEAEGQISPSMAVGNTKQIQLATSDILSYYFKIHNRAKRNILNGILAAFKAAYSGDKAVKLSYVLDDVSVKMLELDGEMLLNNVVGVYVSDSSEFEESIEMLKQLAHAAMQNQRIELSDVVKVLRQKNLVEIEEELEVAENAREEREAKKAQQQQQYQMETLAKQEEIKAQEHKNKLEEIVIKEEERRKTELMKATLLGASFNPDLDKDNDGQNDFLEMYDKLEDNKIKKEKLDLEKKKFEHQKKKDKKELEIKEKSSNKNNKQQ